MEKARISQADLGAVLQKHLQGTPLEPVANNHSYITDETGFVALKTIDSLVQGFQTAINFLQTGRRRSDEVVQSIRAAIDAIKPFGTDVKLN